MTLRRRYSGKTIAAKATALASIIETLVRVAATRASVLLVGDSRAAGLLAHAIHLASPRAMEHFAAVDCAERPPGPLAIDLFGQPSSERGVPAIPGRIASCHRGTILLQRIECTDSVLQSRLAEVIHEHQYRLPDETTVPADLRVIASTPDPLDGMLATGRFREDLFYRLSVVTIVLPPALRKREDITDVIEFFGLHGAADGPLPNTVGKSRSGHKTINRIWSPAARQIERDIARLFSEQPGMPAEAVLAALACVWEAPIPISTPVPNILDQTLLDCVKQSISSRTEPLESLVLRVQKELITQVLKQFEGAQERAAEFLGITPVGLSNKLRELGLQ